MHNGKVKEREPSDLAPRQSKLPQDAAKPAGNRRLLWIMLLLLAGSAAVSYVVFRYIAPRIPRELVGTWQVVDGAKKGATLEFRWTGSGRASIYEQGKKESEECSVRVRGKRIFMTFKAGVIGQEVTNIQTILNLTDDELVIRDQDQNTYHLVRRD